MKFSPKHKAVEVTALIKVRNDVNNSLTFFMSYPLQQRACAMLRASNDLIPEQLVVKNIIVTKGRAIKQMTIQGRGRTGYGYRRYSHIFLTVEQIDFQKRIEDANTQTAKAKWSKMESLVYRLRETPEYYDLQPRIRERQLWKNRDAYDKPKPPRSR